MPVRVMPSQGKSSDRTFRPMLIEALKPRRALVADQDRPKFFRRVLLAATRLRMQLKSTS